MWILLNDCFFSIVRKDCGRKELLVRARRKGDIEKVWPNAKVRRDDMTDYLYRAKIKRKAVERALVQEVRRIQYGNFKDSVADVRLHGAYSRVWADLAELQPGGLFRGSGLGSYRTSCVGCNNCVPTLDEKLAPR